MAMFCHIIDNVFKLEENDIIVSCCASNCNLCPKGSQHKTQTLVSTADKIASLSDNLYDVFAEIWGENVMLKSHVSSINKTEGE